MGQLISVDVGDFRAGGDAAQHFVSELGRAFSETGFVAVRGHDLTEEVQQTLYDNASAFFALDTEEKSCFEHPEYRGQRGYSAFGRESAKGVEAPDLKEFWQHGPTLAPDDPRFETSYPNVECPQVPGFIPAIQEAYNALYSTGASVLEAIALHLGVDRHYFQPHITGGESILRCIHYPPITSEPSNSVRAAAHEDINLITLLMGASAAGLEIEDKSGQWVAITALPGQLVVNVGDMLQRLTNKTLLSTTHRVVNPPREQWGQSRYSMPFFLHPRPEMSLAALPGCVPEGGTVHFAETTAGEYLDERLREIRG